MNRRTVTIFAVIVIILGTLGTLAWSSNPFISDSILSSEPESNFHIGDNIPIADLLINVTDIRLANDGSSSRRLQIHATITNLQDEQVKLDSSNFAIIQYANQWYRQTAFVEPPELECDPEEEEAYYASAKNAQLVRGQGDDGSEDGPIYVKCGVAYDLRKGYTYFQGKEMGDGFSVVNSRVYVDQIPPDSIIRVSMMSPDILLKVQNVLVISNGSESISLTLGSIE